METPRGVDIDGSDGSVFWGHRCVFVSDVRLVRLGFFVFLAPYGAFCFFCSCIAPGSVVITLRESALAFQPQSPDYN